MTRYSPLDDWGQGCQFDCCCQHHRGHQGSRSPLQNQHHRILVGWRSMVVVPAALASCSCTGCWAVAADPRWGAEASWTKLPVVDEACWSPHDWGRSGWLQGPQGKHEWWGRRLTLWRACRVGIEGMGGCDWDVEAHWCLYKEYNMKARL